MYPWAFSRSFIVLLAAVHWHSPAERQVQHTLSRSAGSLLNGVSVLSRNLPTVIDSPRRTPLPSLRVQRDFPPPPLPPPRSFDLSYNAIYPRAFVISENESSLIFDKLPPRFIISRISDYFFPSVSTAVILGEWNNMILYKSGTFALCRCQSRDCLRKMSRKPEIEISTDTFA